ncbi:MAG: hypothetical protein RL385_4460 [Pseudomonadota bacterium]
MGAVVSALRLRHAPEPMPRRHAPATPLDLNLVHTWLRVAELGSFTKAARELGLPTSSVSRAVTRLEEELGADLLLRTTRSLSLTPAGQRYLSSARMALSSLESAREELRDSEGEPRGLVRMTAPLATGSPVDTALATTLSAFGKRYPEVSVEMIFTGRHIDLVNENVDLALRAGPVTDERLVARRIGRERRILVASPEYLREQGTPKKLADLRQHCAILYNGERGMQRWTLSGKDGSETVEVRGSVSSNEMAFTISLAAAGQGIAFVPGMPAELLLRAGTLARVLPDYDVRGTAVSLVYPKRPHEPRRAVVLRDFLTVELRKLFDACPAER